MLEEREAQWVAGHLRTLAGVGEEAELGPERRQEAFAAWRRFLEALASERPLVLVFDDLHSADDSLLDFVDHLVDWASGVPILVLATARPELLERRPGWGGGKPNAATLTLAPLSDEETHRLLGALLDQPLLTAERQSALLARAGGNPLYAEQYVRMLSEYDSTDEMPLPETVQGHDRGPARPPLERGEAPAPERVRGRQGVLAWSRRGDRRGRSRRDRRAAARARAETVRAAGPGLLCCRRDGVLVQAPARAGRRLRPDPAGGARGQASRRSRLDRRSAAAGRLCRDCSPTTTGRLSSSLARSAKRPMSSWHGREMLSRRRRSGVRARVAQDRP